MEMTPRLKQAVKDYKNGKTESYKILYKESEKYIYIYIYKVMSGNNNALDITEEIMQETYLEIFLNISQLENEDRFLSWAGTIATRKCFAYIKKNKKYDTKVKVTQSDGGNRDVAGKDRDDEYNPTYDITDELLDYLYEEPEEPKYTVDEVMSIVKSVFEEGGMRYYPDVFPGCEDPTGGMSWGIDWCPINDVYEYSEKSLEGFVYNGFDVFYLEYLEHDSTHVRIKTYYGYSYK